MTTPPAPSAAEQALLDFARRVAQDPPAAGLTIAGLALASAALDAPVQAEEIADALGEDGGDFAPATIERLLGGCPLIECSTAGAPGGDPERGESWPVFYLPLEARREVATMGALRWLDDRISVARQAFQPEPTGELFRPTLPEGDADLQELVRLRAASSAPWHAGDGTAASDCWGEEALLSTGDRGVTLRAVFNAQDADRRDVRADVAYTLAMDRAVPEMIAELLRHRSNLRAAIPGGPEPMTEHQLDLIDDELAAASTPVPEDGYLGLTRRLLGELRFMRAVLSAHAVKRYVHIAWPRKAKKTGARCGEPFAAILARDLPTAVAYDGIVCQECLKVDPDA